MPADSLDAAFALLDDVRAQSFALELRLRNSLPVRWSGSTLMLQRAPRPSPAAFTRQTPRDPSSSHANCHQETAARSNDSSSNWSREWRQRKLEWDVSKRIARIDRELASLPPAQRFWHRRQHRREQERAAQLRAQEAAERTSSARDAGIEKKAPRNQRSERLLANGNTGASTKLRVGEASWLRVKDDPIAADHRVSVAQARVPPPKSSSARRHRKPLVEETARQARQALGAMAGKTAAVRNAHHTRPPSTHPGLRVDPPVTLRKAHGDSSDGNSVTPTEEGEKENQPQDPQPTLVLNTADDVVKPLDSASHIPSSNNDDQPRPRCERKPPAPRPQFTQPVASSVGRQVLSEFRNAPSTALYGPPAVCGNPNAPGRRLNSDVLRRLFNDLDADHDGHLNRIETCVALHRLQIAVSAPKIAAFFRRVHTQSGAQRTSKRGSDRGNTTASSQYMPLLEVISYKQFVAFVTAAYDQQRGQQRPRLRPPSAPASIVSNDKTELLEHAKAHAPHTQQQAPHSSQQMHTSTSHPPSAIRIYELDSPTAENSDEQREWDVLEIIPEYLVSRLLEGEDTDELRVERTEEHNTGDDIVSRNEPTLPRDSVDSQVRCCRSPSQPLASTEPND